MVTGPSDGAQVIASWVFWLGDLDPPMTAHRSGELLGRQEGAQDVVARLQTLSAPRIDSIRGRHSHGAQAAPLPVRIDRLRGRQDRIRPRLLAAVALLHRLVLVAVH